jgi:hypothetical protein
VCCEEGGARLFGNALKLFELPNLKLVQAGIGAGLPAVDVIRCFNVFAYFDGQFRKRAEDWALRTLRPGGLFVCGGDQALSLDTRYSVYRNENGQLVPKEFAFSIDNLQGSSIIPWCASYEDERDLWTLARLLRILRGDNDFTTAYRERSDALSKRERLWVRDAAGCLAPAPDQIPQSQWFRARETIATELEQEEFAVRAAAILRKAGLHAWVNHAGHIAVDPTELWSDT